MSSPFYWWWFSCVILNEHANTKIDLMTSKRSVRVKHETHHKLGTACWMCVLCNYAVFSLSFLFFPFLSIILNFEPKCGSCCSCSMLFRVHLSLMSMQCLLSFSLVSLIVSMCINRWLIPIANMSYHIFLIFLFFIFLVWFVLPTYWWTPTASSSSSSSSSSPLVSAWM